MDETQFDPVRNRRLRLWQPMSWLLFLAAAALCANLALKWRIPLPFCLLRETTGIPCPACGSTRALLAWTHFDLASAFRFNPLFFVACLVLAGWTSLQIMESFTAPKFSARITSMARTLPMLRIGIGLLAVNWVYLYLTLPR